jgi:hypothetical protein
LPSTSERTAYGDGERWSRRGGRSVQASPLPGGGTCDAWRAGRGAGGIRRAHAGSAPRLARPCLRAWPPGWQRRPRPVSRPCRRPGPARPVRRPPGASQERPQARQGARPAAPPPAAPIPRARHHGTASRPPGSSPVPMPTNPCATLPAVNVHERPHRRPGLAALASLARMRSAAVRNDFGYPPRMSSGGNTSTATSGGIPRAS